jgi:hypothetical protein
MMEILVMCAISLLLGLVVGIIIETINHRDR